MEIRKFDYWLGRRQNHVDESWLDRILGRESKTAAAAAPNITEPSQVYSDRTVQRYAKEVEGHLGLRAGLEIIDDAGNVKGNFTQPTLEFNQALMRFIAGHVLGNKNTFLNISQHDAAFILNYLDHLRVPGEQQTISERLYLKNPNSLSQWLRNHVPTSDDALMQQGFGDASDTYSSPRKLGQVLKNEKVMNLARNSYDLVKLIKERTRGKSITIEIYKLCEKLSDAIGAVGIDVTELMKPAPAATTPQPPPGGKPKFGPGPLGTGRGRR